MKDKFGSHYPSLSTPGENHFPVIIGTSFDTASRALYVGTGGTIVIRTVNDDDAAYVNVANGTILPIRAKVVLDSDGNGTSTDASDIVGIY